MNIVLTKEYVDRKSIYCDLVVLYTINRNPNNNRNIWFIPFAQAIPDERGNLGFKPITQAELTNYGTIKHRMDRNDLESNNGLR